MSPFLDHAPIAVSHAIDRDFASSQTITRSEMARHARFRGRVKFTSELGRVLLEYYLCYGCVAVLLAAKHVYQAHLELVTIVDPLLAAQALCCVADVMFAAYEQACDLDELNKAIRVYKKAISCSSVSLPGHCDIEVGLAWALWHRFQNLSTESDCRAAVQILEAARHRVGVSQGEQVRILAAFGRVRFQTSTRSVMPTTPEELMLTLTSLNQLQKDKLNLPRSQYINSLITEAYLNTQLSMGSLVQKHLDDGFRAVREALRLCPMQPTVLRYSGEAVLCFLHFYSTHRSHSDKPAWELHMNAAIEIANRMKSDFSHHNVTCYMNALGLWGMALGLKSEQSGDLEGLELGINALKHALAICPQNHASKSNLVNHQVVLLSKYYQVSGRISVLDQLIALRDLGHDFLAKTPFLASNIAENILKRARISDLNTAISLINSAIHICQHCKTTQGFASQRPTERINIDLCIMDAVRLQIRMDIQPLSRDPVDLIQIAREDIGLLDRIPSFDFTRIDLVLSQADFLKYNAMVNSHMPSLQQAQQLIKEEIDSSGAVNVPHWNSDLIAMQADLLVAQTNLQGKQDELLQRAWVLYQSAAQIPKTSWHERFRICLKWASEAITHGCSRSALTAYVYAISLLPSVIFLGEDVVGRIDALRQVRGLSASAVAVALSLGEIDIALDFLENTRGILWSQSLQARAPDLHLLPNTVRQKFLGLIHGIETASVLQWSLRRQRAEELQQAVSEIRALPGFDRFLLPPRLAELQSALQNRGGLAIILVPKSVHEDRVRELALAFSDECATARHARKLAKAMIAKSDHPSARELLSELWKCLVRPLMEHLNLPKVSQRKNRQRVWWCPIGASGSLPLHAAGVYDGLTEDSADDYIVSSYTPTLSALHRLLDTTANQPITLAEAPSVLLVAQPNAENLPYLPNAQTEVELVRTLIPLSYFTNQSDPRDISVSTALDGAATAHVIHFACHGVQDQENPLNSGFELKDGRLTLGQLMRAQASHAQLAYLSACESAGLDENRPDEGLNLVGAMIFAGFKSVVGTMWAMDDIDGPFMAKHIYSRIFRDGALNINEVPYAVNEAVRELRDSGVPASRWATYVHFGL